MKAHKYAELFPAATKEELEGLKADIMQRGLLNPIIIYQGQILDGRSRHRACQETGVKANFADYKGKDPLGDVVAWNLHRRHLSTSQKAALAVELKPLFEEQARERQRQHGGTAPGKKSLRAKMPEVKGRSRDQAAAAVGAKGRTVEDAAMLKKRSPERFEKVKEGKMTVGRAKKELVAEERKADLRKAQESIIKRAAESIESVCDLRVCSCAELFKDGARPDAVITDPPYSREFLPAFTELAESCKLACVPLVAVMSGQSYFPEVMSRLCEHLKYRWIISYLTPGGRSVQQWNAKVNTFWKPVVLFGAASDWIGDVAASKVNDNDKSHHGWGQSESGMADLVERLTKPGQLVCDPFLGGGTTAVISLALGRRFVGCDIDAKCIENARRRIEEFACRK